MRKCAWEARLEVGGGDGWVRVLLVVTPPKLAGVGAIGDYLLNRQLPDSVRRLSSTGRPVAAPIPEFPTTCGPTQWSRRMKSEDLIQLEYIN